MIELIDLFSLNAEEDEYKCHPCWRYHNDRDCFKYKKCHDIYDKYGAEFNCAEKYNCGTCETCDTPYGAYFRGPCDYAQEALGKESDSPNYSGR